MDVNDEVQQAVEAEKTFNNRNLLLITFSYEDLLTDSFQDLHKSIKNVQNLKPDFVPKQRCIIEVNDLFDIHLVREAFMKHNFQGRKVQVKFLEKSIDTYTNLDPHKLEVHNLPNNISIKELKLLFPLSIDHTFYPTKSQTKKIILHFSNVQDAISAFKSTNCIEYESNTITVKFFRKTNNSIIPKTNVSKKIVKRKSFTEEKDSDFWDTSEDEVQLTAISCSVSEEPKDNDIVRWKKIQTDSLKNKKVSDVLIVRNLPESATGEDIGELFPSLYRYKFISNDSKSCIIRFKKIEDAISMYKESDNIFQSRILQIDFYDKNLDPSFWHKSWRKIRRAGINVNSSKIIEIDSGEKENIREDSVDSLILHVKNLPFLISNEEIQLLYPDLHEYQIIPEEKENSSSAFICFKKIEDAQKACNATNKTFFKQRQICVSFKEKKIRINPFALLKRKNDNEISNETSKKSKTDNNNIVPTLNGIDTTYLANLNNLTRVYYQNEDEVAVKSENEEYSDEEEENLTDTDVEILHPNEVVDDIPDDYEQPGKDLESNNILPIDEDGF